MKHNGLKGLDIKKPLKSNLRAVFLLKDFILL